ncbi:MAG: daunorubicin/doxorubicin resistance ABC transporter ATP-binding protein DrrA, partial [Mycobacteriaceae bacterium]
DEPTTGLDPRGRIDVWDAVQSAATDGTTVLLTTQYLEEADHLADRISIMKDGRIIAEGTPEELKRSRGGDRIDITLPDDQSISRPAPNGASDLIDAVRDLDAQGVTPVDIALRRPTLDEVFLAVTDTPAAKEAR